MCPISAERKCEMRSWKQGNVNVLITNFHIAPTLVLYFIFYRHTSNKLTLDEFITSHLHRCATTPWHDILSGEVPLDGGRLSVDARMVILFGITLHRDECLLAESSSVWLMSMVFEQTTIHILCRLLPFDLAIIMHVGREHHRSFCKSQFLWLSIPHPSPIFSHCLLSHCWQHANIPSQPMSFSKLTSYSKPDQPSNALHQEKQWMRERNQLHWSLYFKDGTNLQGIQLRKWTSETGGHVVGMTVLSLRGRVVIMARWSVCRYLCGYTTNPCLKANRVSSC